MQKSLKIREFINRRIQQIDQQSQNEGDLMTKLKLSSMRSSFANILNVYLNNDKQEVGLSCLKHAKIYLESNSFQQAVHYAEMARKDIKNAGLIQECFMIELKSYLQLNKLEEAQQLLKQIQPNNQRQNFYEYKALILQRLGNQQASLECLERLQQLIRDKYSQKSLQYGLFLVKKGKAKRHFEKYRQALRCIKEGIEVLMEVRYKNNIQIGQIYLVMAQCNRKLEDLQAEYTSLVCASSMYKQDSQKQKEFIDIQHKIVENLLSQQDYDSALKQLSKIQTLQKHLYGQSSLAAAKTIKTICDILIKCNRRHEAKKYEVQYSRIISCTDKKAGVKEKPLIYSRLKSQ